MDEVKKVVNQVSIHAMRQSMITVIALFAIALFLVAYRGDKGDEHIEHNTAILMANQVKLDKMTSELTVLIDEHCVQSQVSARGINTVLDTLITATKGFNISKTFTVADRAARVEAYKKALVVVPVCTKS